jgi:DNA-binding XRE family transcriptional regulator
MPQSKRPHGAKLAAKKAPSRRRPADAGKPRQRRAAALTPRLRKVLERFSQPKLAKICGVTRQAVNLWLERGDIPPQHALAIEKASAGELTKEFLAPSFYPRPAA